MHTTGFRTTCLLLLVTSLLLAGCSSDRPETVPVSGKVTFGGGDWPKPGLIYFSSIESAPGLPSRPGTAYFGTDGRFSAQTFEGSDGLIPGRYAVAFECWEVPPILGEGPPKSYLAEKYQHGSTSEIEFVVERGARSAEFIYDVPDERPAD